MKPRVWRCKCNYCKKYPEIQVWLLSVNGFAFRSWERAMNGVKEFYEQV